MNKIPQSLVRVRGPRPPDSPRASEAGTAPESMERSPCSATQFDRLPALAARHRRTPRLPANKESPASTAGDHSSSGKEPQELLQELGAAADRRRRPRPNRPQQRMHGELVAGLVAFIGNRGVWSPLSHSRSLPGHLGPRLAAALRGTVTQVLSGSMPTKSVRNLRALSANLKANARPGGGGMQASLRGRMLTVSVRAAEPCAFLAIRAECVAHVGPRSRRPLRTRQKRSPRRPTVPTGLRDAVQTRPVPLSS